MAQNQRLEIILDVQGEKFYLDTSGIENIPLTFNVNNLKDISQTKGSFSKTIVVPETGDNRIIFDNITDLNSESTFDPNLRNRAYVLVDSIMVFEGYFQLSEFQIDNNLYKNSLSLYLVSDVSDLYTVIGEDFIETLDFSEFNHLYNYTNIVNSWDKDWKNGFYYPLIDNGYDWDYTKISGLLTNTSVALNQMYPAVYVRQIWDKIFNEAGFTYNSHSLRNIVPFNDLILPFNSKDITNTQEYVNAHGFKVGLNYTGTEGQSISLGYKYHNLTFTGGSPVYQDTNNPFWGWQPGTMNGQAAYTWIDSWSNVPGSSITLNTHKIEFNNESNPYDDPNNLWSLTDFKYENTDSYPVTQRFNINMNILMKWRYASNNLPKVIMKKWNPISGITQTVPICDEALTNNFLYVGRDQNTIVNNNVWSYMGYLDSGVIIPGFYEGTTTGLGGFPSFWDNFEMSPGLNRVGFSTKLELYKGSWSTPTMTIQPGEKIWLEFEYVIAGDTLANDVYSFPYGYELAKIIVGIDTQYRTSLANEISSVVIPGDNIVFNNVISKQVKKRDFLLSIIKMFNLIVEPSKDDPRVLNIETSDYYYSQGVIKDWSKDGHEKVDNSQPIDVQVLGDVQNKRFTFKYKDDKDYLNTDYLSQTKKTYGEKQFITDNEFSDGEKKVEVIFSPTPLVKVPYTKILTPVQPGLTYSAIVIPKIFTENNGTVQTTQSNLRILLKKKMTLQPESYWTLQSNDIVNPFAVTTQTSYPYAGHFDDPSANMKIDINWDVTDYLYYEVQALINSNLYMDYWRKTVEEITDKDSRIVTLSAYLDPKDIYDLKFNDKIFINGQYYKLSKVDYDPSIKQISKVELIKTLDITIPKFNSIGITPPFQDLPILTNAYSNFEYAVNPGTSQPPINHDSGLGSILTGFYNISSGNNNVIDGLNNNISGDNISVVGSDNVVGVSQNTNDGILGNNNSMPNGVSDSFIIGNNNELSLVENSIIIGNNLKSYESNTTTIGGIIVTENNCIDAGRNIVMDPFNENSEINYISGSSNAVREPGSYININFITAGRVTI